jgi:hypothetical protein
MAVRTPSGRTLPGNLAIIPSEQSWVFHAIYQHAFPHLYSSKVCSRKRLVLTDKDEAEYRSFEALIKTPSDFKQSTVMLCTFHDVWMAFKKGLLTLLEECYCGKVYSKLVYLHTNFYNRIHLYQFILILIFDTCLDPQRSGYTSHSCIKHVYLRTRTSMTCLIRYWQMSYQMHSWMDISNNLWRRLLKHFKSN